MKDLIALTGRDYLSYSSMTSWLDCGQRFELERVLNAPQQRAWWFVGGDALHRASEMLDKKVTEDPLDAWHQSWEISTASLPSDESTIRAGGRRSRDWPDKENRAWWEHHGPIMTTAWKDWMEAKQKEGWAIHVDENKRIGVETGFTMSLADVTVKGFVDRIMIDPNGQVVVVDLKAGSREPKNSLQLAVYALGIKQTLGLTPSLGGYWMARTAEIPMLHTLSHLDESLVGQWFSSAKHGIENEIFIPRVSELCVACTVAPYCPAVGGNKALLNDFLQA